MLLRAEWEEQGKEDQTTYLATQMAIALDPTTPIRHPIWNSNPAN